GKPEAEARPIRKVGIVGAGLMASQLATLFLRRLEVPIAIRDLDQEIVDRAVASIGAELESQVQKGRYDEGKARFLASLVDGGTTYD
ncbi:3-hydroxyacyl-CoA dehydrogenase NAD-binding domain-containing protein, partial [Salmonella sp. SAL4358]|uniref:3-hydroxyacyl-CoA dehydrogenase NAD-binding domain-containing protein n=1 Tax=Salmonella sp. SAL4358 TaxID=3159879 RepID=UPI00397D061B